ncbi:MAG: hypothetical protein U0414_15460 [Polyangiaceae bacterium]
MRTRALMAALLGSATIVSSGCAEERAPINRVQPNALAKSFFVGKDLKDPNDDPEFYALATIVDVGYGAAQDGLFTSTYAQPISRIKWVIQEDLLIGRATYERIENSDHKGVGSASTDGQVAYVYPILSHFDIRRDYNPTTGEDSNVIVENSSDRPWDQREYMRVDWSRNLNTDAYDFDTLSLMGLYGSVAYEPLAYYVNDPDSPDAPHFNVEAGYFDVTNKAFAQPGLIDLSGLGWGINQFPACYLETDFFNGSAPSGNCNPVEITMRQSFRRVEKSDYEPAEWDGYMFQHFGPFETERRGYARNYGMTDTQWHRFADRYNIWEKHHAYVAQEGGSCGDGWVPSTDYPGQCEVACNTIDKTGVGGNPHRDGDASNPADGTEDECVAVTSVYGGGSTCDQFKQKCTLPYNKRTEKPIVWHVSKNSNQQFFEGTKMAAQEWDVAMRMAVVTAKYAECVKLAADAAGAAACKDSYPLITGQQAQEFDAVQLATEVDACRSEGTDEATCEGLADSIGAARGYAPGVIATAKLPEMLVLCHGPVEQGDSPLCVADFKAKDPRANDTRAVLEEGAAAECDAAWSSTNPDDTVKAKCDNSYYVRQGDVRFHQINIIKTPQTPSPWGIMTDSDDPLTGEKVAASINIWSHVNDLAAQQLIDMARYVKGEFTTEDITDGVYVHNWAAAGEGANRGATMDRATLDRRIEGAANAASMRGIKNKLSDLQMPSPEKIAKVAALKQEFKSVRADAGAQTTSAPIYAARRQAAIGSQTEASLLTAPMLQYGGVVDPALPQPFVFQNASILQAANPEIREAFHRAKELALADRGACMLNEAPTPNNVGALSDVLERKFGKFDPTQDRTTQDARARQMQAWVAQRYQYGVIIHEMGHSMALRHNFVTSYNSWGFRPQYWQLRTDDGKNTTECTDVSKDGGKDCVGPRYFDPVNQNERDNMIWMFEQSSVMDYPGDVSQDIIGLGGYDFASVRAFYGGVASVYADDDFKAKSAHSKAMLNIMDSFGGILGVTFTDGKTDTSTGGPREIHYSQQQKDLKLIQNCQEVDPQAFKPADWDEAKWGVWDPLVDGMIVSQSNGKYTRCEERSIDYVPFSQLRDPKSGELGGVRFDSHHAIDRFDRTRVPYAFATDSWADLGNLSVYRHDNGADPYELFNFFISEQETRHIFDNYRHDRNTFSVRGASNRILERYNEKMRDGAKGLTLQYNFLKDLFANDVNPEDFDSGLWLLYSDLLWRDQLVASGLAFDHFARQLQRPESGIHSLNHGIWKADNAGTMIIPDGSMGDPFGNVTYGGKPIENKLSENHGEYDRDYTLNAGAYYDKVFAPYLLTESVDNFISAAREDFVDARFRAVSMADLFPDAYRRLVGNLLTGDEALKGVAVQAQNGAPILDADKYPKNGLGWTSWITDKPEDCFPGPTGIICSSYGCDGGICDFDGSQFTFVPLDNQAATPTVVVDSEIGWEQQKFIIAQTLLYLPENQKQNWINQLGIWEIGSDSDPSFQNRIEFHSPDGKIYVAQTFGTETIRGKTVQRGIGARVLEWANGLLTKGYQTTLNADGYPVADIAADGHAIVKFANLPQTIPNPNCHAADKPNVGDPADNTGCTCTSNPACVALENYVSMPAFIRQSMHDFRMADATMKGIYD